MNNIQLFIDNFIVLVKQCPNFKYIKSILISGSSINPNVQKPNDIDFLLICNDNSGKTIFKEIKQERNNPQLLQFLDIKIIEEHQIDKINNSVDTPFFFHFVNKAKILYGRDLRKNFKLNKSVCNKSIYNIFDNIEKIKEIFYSYNKKQLAEVLLFENARKLAVIYELLSSNIEKDNYKSKKIVKQIYGEKLLSLMIFLSQTQGLLIILEHSTFFEYVYKYKRK